MWVFDPLDVAGWPEPMTWNPVAGAQHSAAAVARGKAFAAGFGADTTDSSNPFFRHAAGIIVARLLHAAALVERHHGRRRRPGRWSWNGPPPPGTSSTTIPDAELFWAKTLHAASEGADDTLSSVRMTLAQKVEPILSRTVMRQMLPTAGVQVFDPAAFVHVHGHPGVDHRRPGADQRRTADHHAARRGHRRRQSSTPPGPAPAGWTRRCGSSATRSPTSHPYRNSPGCCPTPGASASNGSPRSSPSRRSIARWGEDDGRQILANLNCSLILGGLQDEKALDRFSALVGDTDVTEVSATLDAANTATGSTVTTTERTALRAEEIRLIPDGQALVIYRNAPAMLVTLIPWTHRPDGAGHRRRDHPGPHRPHHPPTMTSDRPTDHESRRRRPVEDAGATRSTADRLTVLWNGFEELTARLDTTEDAVAATLDTLSADVDDLKTQLAQLLKKEQEKDVKPRRWAARATGKDWDTLIDWVDRAEHRATHSSATTPSRPAGPPTPASSRNSPACTGPGPAP